MTDQDQDRADRFGRQVRALRSLSYSSITTYLKCPHQWYWWYIKRTPRPHNEALVYGSAMHATWTSIQVLQAQGRTGDTDLIWEREFNKAVDASKKKGGGIDWGDSSFDASLQEGLRFWGMDGINVRFVSTFSEGGWDARERENVFDTVMDVVRMFPVVKTKSKRDFALAGEDAPGHPAVERFVSGMIPGVPKKLLGYIDWIGPDGIPHDLKTSGRSWYKSKEEQSIQPNIYLALMMINAPELLNEMLKFNYVVIVRTKTPKIQIITTRRTTEQITWTMRLVARVWQDMLSGRVTPNPEFQWCGRGCQFWGNCMGRREPLDDKLEKELESVLNINTRFKGEENGNVS